MRAWARLLEPTSTVHRAVHLGAARATALLAKSLMFFLFGLTVMPAVYGIISVSFALASLFTLLLDGGVGLLLLREASNGIEKPVKVLGGLFAARALLLVPVLLVFAGTARVVLGHEFNIWLVLSIGAYLLLQQVGQTLFEFLRGIQSTSLEGFFGFCLGTAELGLLGGWYLFSGRSPLALFAIMASIRAGAVLLLASIVLRRFRARIDLGEAVLYLRKNQGWVAAFFFFLAVQYLHANSDVVMLRLFRDSGEAGNYWACFRLFAVLGLPVDLLVAAAMSRFAALDGRPADLAKVFRGVHRIGICWTLPIIAGVAVNHDLVIRVLLGPQFEGVQGIFSILALGVGLVWMPPYGLGLVVGARPASAIAGYAIAAVVNIGANLALIPKYGSRGAAWATVLSYLVAKIIFWRAFRAQGLQVVPWRDLLVTAMLVSGWLVAARALGCSEMQSMVGIVAGAIILVGRQIPHLAIDETKKRNHGR